MYCFSCCSKRGIEKGSKGDSRYQAMLKITLSSRARLSTVNKSSYLFSTNAREKIKRNKIQSLFKEVCLCLRMRDKTKIVLEGP